MPGRISPAFAESIIYWVAGGAAIFMTDAPRPNFFIIGAPKCGTTSLFDYLAEHPRIGMSSRKEPNYFAALGRDYDVASLDDYLKLFAKARDKDCLAIGEGSTNTIYTPGALERLKAFEPNAKIVIMLRNPIELIQSLHSYDLFKMQEDVEDFEEAWHLQEVRAKGQRIPPKSVNPEHLQYGQMGMLGRQVSHVLELFPRENVWIGFAEDMRTDCRGVYESLLAFLGVPSDNRTEFPVSNESRTHTSKLSKMLIRPPRPIILLAKKLGLQNTGLLIKTSSRLAKPTKRTELRPEFRRQLADYFREDVLLLSSITGRDLSVWLNPSTS
jgi:hypothetical protein